MSDLMIEIVEGIEEVLKKYADVLQLEDRDSYEVASAMLGCYLEGEI